MYWISEIIGIISWAFYPSYKYIVQANEPNVDILIIIIKHLRNTPLGPEA